MVSPSVLLAGTASLSLASAATFPLIDTAQGPVVGGPSEYRQNVTVYKGIPFAAPPVDELRFQPPAAPANRSATLNATTYGPQCMQMTSSQGIFATGSTDMSEDCLYLNIWTPEYNTTDADEIRAKNLPVYYWIYGGRYEMGSGDVVTYDGSGLAIKDIIVVTVNYRVGAFGYLAHPLLSAESPHNSSGNYGTLDQIAGLQWVHDNIANFGGNPDQIVTGGQSAGSASSLIMAYSPLSRDLIAGAISESGACASHDPSIASLAVSYRMPTEAYKLGVSVFEELNVTTPAELRALSTDTINNIDSTNEDLLDGKRFDGFNSDPPAWRPMVDGWVLHQKYGALLASNDHGNVPIMTGFNSGEGTTGTTDVATYIADYTQWMGNFSAEFFALWPGNNDTQATDSMNDFRGVLSRASSYLYATEWINGGAESNIYNYFFTRAPQEDHADGAYHGAELWYTFNNIPYADYTANLTWPIVDYQIENNMSDYWVNFVRTGNPNGADLAQWNPTSVDNKEIMYLGNSWGPEVVATDAKLEFIQKWFASLYQW